MSYDFSEPDDARPSSFAATPYTPLPSNQDAPTSVPSVRSEDLPINQDQCYSTTVDHRTAGFELTNSTILDSGTTVHVCNDRTRFVEYRAAK
jgi:hypothetical protein